MFISDDLSEEEEGGREIKSSDTKRCALVSSEALAVLEEFSGSMGGWVGLKCGQLNGWR